MYRLCPALGILLLSTLVGCAAFSAPPPSIPDASVVPLADLDADSATELLLTVHEELGSGYEALVSAQQMRSAGALMCVTGIGAPLVTAGDSSDSYVKIGVSFAATGVLVWLLGVGKGARATNQIKEAYARLDAAVLGNRYLTPEERRGPPRRTRFGD